MESKKVRYVWVDLAKGVAIIGVVLDHLFNRVYTSRTILVHTSFCVSLFILMAGFTVSLSLSKSPQYNLRRMLSKVCTLKINAT